jgi:hypothetical protein
LASCSSKLPDLVLGALHVLLDQQRRSMNHAAGIRHARRRDTRAFRLAAVDRIDVQGRVRAPEGTTGMSRAALGQARIQVALQALDEGVHVPDGAVAEERHRAVRHAPPWVSISAHHTPRWPMQTRSTLSGSG